MAKIKKFSIVEKPNKKAVFRSLPGWKFDEGVWVHPLETNSEFKLPLKSDLDLTGIPEEFYESGIVGPDDLEFDELNFEDERLMIGWTPGVRRGQYFSHSSQHNLHSSESIIVLATDEVNDDGRSIINLDQAPHPLLPITAEYLQRDITTYAIETQDKFTKVSVFKGVASNGRELDGEEPENTDTTALEFKIEKNDSDPRLGVEILIDDLVEIELDIYEIEKVSGVVSWHDVIFSRPDIFRNEIPFETFMARQVDPVTNGDLEEGNYCIGYKGSWTEDLPMRVYLTQGYQNYGHVSFKPEKDTVVIFNQDVKVDRVATFDNDQNDYLFYLPNFPVMDLTAYQDGELAGPLALDTTSGALTVGAVRWDRVADLADAGPADEVYELDPLWGVIRFGDGGITTNGAAPIGEIIYTYTQVPLVQYDPLNARELFDDSRENLDPQVNSLKRGFLVLDNRRLEPWKIRLSTNARQVVRDDGIICSGSISVPASGIDDVVTLKAKVVARGNPEIGVPNIPVRFESLDGLVSFSQEFAVTDGEGYAYTEAIVSGHFEEYAVADWMVEPMDSDVVNYLNPDPADGDLLPEIPPWGAHITGGTTLTIGEVFNGDLEDVYLLIQSIPSDTVDDLLDYSGNPLAPDEYLEPYNGKTRRGGLTVVWHRTIAESEELVHPISATPNAGNPAWTDLEFPINIPTGQLIVSYKLVIDRTAHVVAHTVEDPILISNEIVLCTSLNDELKGQWKLPNLLEPDWDGLTVNPPAIANLDGSRLTTGVFISPNDFEVLEIQPVGGGAPITDADVTDAIDIVGKSFPTTEELYVSVFMIKADADGNIIAVKNITDDVTFVDATTIRIASLPTPPTEEYDIDYWIAVGGFHPEDPDTNLRRTAVPLEIGAAP